MESVNNSRNGRKQTRRLLFVEDKARSLVTDYQHLRFADARRLSTAIYVHWLLSMAAVAMKRLAEGDTGHFNWTLQNGHLYSI